MANKPGRIGRDGEHIARRYLEEAGFPDVEREGKRAASLDLLSPDLTVPLEVKRRGTLAIPDWTRTLESRHGSEWGLFVVQRDARRKLHPDLLVFPAAFGARLLRLCETQRAFLREELGL